MVREFFFSAVFGVSLAGAGLVGANLSAAGTGGHAGGHGRMFHSDGHGSPKYGGHGSYNGHGHNMFLASQARGNLGAERVFYYQNGPLRAFTYATPDRRHGSVYYGPWPVGPYGPGFGYPDSYYRPYFPYHEPVGVYRYSPDRGQFIAAPLAK